MCITNSNSTLGNGITIEAVSCGGTVALWEWSNMNKPLDEMTDQELCELFPIILSAYDPIWKENYLKEQIVLEQAIG